jgi:hypothetical protein
MPTGLGCTVTTGGTVAARKVPGKIEKRDGCSDTTAKTYLGTRKINSLTARARRPSSCGNALDVVEPEPNVARTVVVIDNYDSFTYNLVQYIAAPPRLKACNRAGSCFLRALALQTMPG